ncbi:hypothetical protein [Deinococcus sp. JMULE3]|uniref:hypothetical protein n=1 Tax=Deinococcus sp. JMULE3 TaxID=2518341 RepID=UPI00157754BC|nr:hypothetical protein [Deinococcus sp. JMULE3]NTY00095.1 hypothetical protein [Deinococcus sp. JMULE3]
MKIDRASADNLLVAARHLSTPARMLSGTPSARLTAAQVTEVQRDLILLMCKVAEFTAANDGAGQPVLLRLGLAPLTEDELLGLHR